MTIHGLLNIGRHAMIAHRGAMELSSQNAANVATDGYSRRRGTLSSLGLDAGRHVAAGVKLGSPQRVIDALSARSVRLARSEVGFHQGRQAALQTIEAVVAPEVGGVSESMDGFFESISRLTSRPDGHAERVAVLHAADEMAREISTAYETLGEMRRPLDNVATDTVGRVNVLASRVADINGRLAAAESGGAEAVELRDERDRLADELAALTGGQIVEHKDGQVTIQIPDGPALVSGKESRSLRVETDNGELRLSLVSADGSDRIAIDGMGGELGGTIQARNGDIADAMAALDALAFGLAGAMNDLHTQGVGLDGNTGRALFDGGDTLEGAAGRLTLSESVRGNPDALATVRDPNDLPGGTDLALELSGVRGEPIDGLGGRTVIEALTDLQVEVGKNVDQTLDRLDVSRAQAQVYEGLRESTRGVSLDEELADIMKFQRGFEAASRVIRSADEMMQTVLSMV